jgi:LuxR family maltose regulon positive regulatory protein
MPSLYLLTTKLAIPPAAGERAPRPHLLEKLDHRRQPGTRLVLVCAPAGYGKTTLAADWARTSPGGVAWLSLDPADNDPNQFLAYLVAALRTAIPALPLNPQTYLHAQQTAPLEPTLAELINLQAEAGTPTTLILDDYHVIQNPAIHEGMAFWLDHLPAGARLLLTTRVDPPLPLHRYRARRQLVELRADDLRFTAAETADFFAHAAGLSLGPEDLAVLDTRLEGWAAGLQMAALSFERRTEIPRILHALASSQSYLLDYLAEEVLNNQPEDLRRFLLSISILDRFSAPLCEAVTDAAPGVSERLIEQARRANLFLAPLDAEGEWFRFHNLFASLLRVRLKKLAPDTQPGLHARAAAWLEAHDFLHEAIHHTLQAGDYDRAAALVERHTAALLARGDLHALLGWIKSLPEETARTRPWLCVSQAWALAFAGQPGEVGQLLQQAEVALQAQPEMPPGERQCLAYELTALRLMMTVMAGQQAELAALEAAACHPPAEGSLWAQAAAWWTWGYACRTLGRLDEAQRAFAQMTRLGEKMENLWTTVTGHIDQGSVLRAQGRLSLALQTYQTGLDLVRGQTVFAPGFVGRLESLLAMVHYELNDLAQAHRLAEDSLRHNQGWRNPNHDTHAWLARALVALAEADAAQAGRALAEAGQVVAKGAVVRLLQSSLEAVQVRYWLAAQDMAAAQQWAEVRAPLAGKLAEMLEPEQLALARVWVAAGEGDRAMPLLSTLEAAARAAGGMTTLVETLALRALAETTSGAALETLQPAVALGEPEGFGRVFLDLGEPMRLLLRNLARSPLFKNAPARLKSYVERLLGAFPLPAPLAGAQPSAARPDLAQIVEPLTGRELEILRALAEGLTNPQIGARLYVSTGTVKAHTAAIFRKLAVANRAEAVARAKDLKLL